MWAELEEQFAHTVPTRSSDVILEMRRVGVSVQLPKKSRFNISKAKTVSKEAFSLESPHNTFF